MGTGQSKNKAVEVKLPEIPKNSPLGFMLDNWKHYPSTKGKDRAKMIHYCVELWGGQEISKYVYWPIFGSEEDWVRQRLNLWVNTKTPPNPEESSYAAVWVERPRVAIYKLSQKSKPRRREEEIIALPPYVPPVPAAPPLPPPQDLVEPPVTDEDSGQEEDNRPRTRSQTRGRKERLFPLREVPMGGQQPGIGFVSVPLSPSDVRDFKKEMGKLLEDPMGVAERVDQFLGPNHYTWEEMNSILGILFTTEERNMIRTAGMRAWDARPGNNQNPAEQKWPLQNPHWDNQNPVHRGNMNDFRTILIEGIRESVPRGQNIDKAFNDRQRKDEDPTDWLERLRRNFRLFSGMDPDSEAAQQVLKVQFVAKSWEDIKKKIQKMEDWQDRDLPELLREAQKVYVRRDTERERRQARLMALALKEGRSEDGGRRKTVGRSGSRELGRERVEQSDLGKEKVCYYCGRKGHFRRECRVRIRDEKMFKED